METQSFHLLRHSKGEAEMRRLAIRTLFAVLGTAAVFGAVVYAQDTQSGKLKISVSPKEAYIFVDGQGIAPGTRSIPLSVGNHKVLVANYGYRFVEREVTINSNEITPLDVPLEPEGDVVFSPKGRIQIETGHLDAGDDAVLLNGKSPSYFVGHVDEFNNELFFRQELIVPPGNHLVTVTRHGKEVWSGMISVPEDKRVIVALSNGKIVTKDWPRGKELGAPCSGSRRALQVRLLQLRPLARLFPQLQQELIAGMPASLDGPPQKQSRAR